LRLWTWFKSAQAAAHCARDLSGALTVAGAYVLFEEDHFGPRLGLLAHRQGGTALVLTSKRVIVSGTFSHSEPGPPDVVPLLRPYLTPDDRLEFNPPAKKWVTVEVNTLEPGRVLKALVELEALLGVPVWIRVQADNPFAEALHRIRRDLEADVRRG
jgi:hypothetical protein